MMSSRHCDSIAGYVCSLASSSTVRCSIHSGTEERKKPLWMPYPCSFPQLATCLVSRHGVAAYVRIHRKPHVLEE